MKLDDFHIGISPITDEVYVGILASDTEWRQKVNRTSEFLATLLAWCPAGCSRDIRSRTTDGGEVTGLYRVTVERVDPSDVRAQAKTEEATS